LQRIFGEGVQFNANELQAGIVFDLIYPVLSLSWMTYNYSLDLLRAGQGSGLGLFISAGIVTLHGGKISVRSAGLGKGTTFTVVLPVIKINDEVGGIKSDFNSELSKPDSLTGIVDPPCDQTIFTAVGATRVINSRVLKRLLVVDDSLPNRSVSMIFFALPLNKVMLC